MDDQTKQYLEVLFAGLRTEITSIKENFRDELARLGTEILKQGASIHTIELGMTQKFAKLESDINSAHAKIREIENQSKTEEDSRVQSDISLGTRLTTFETAQSDKWKAYVEFREKQAVENDRNANARKFLAAVGFIVLAEIIYLLWNILLNGGIRNITP
jgi:hypothetical protein